jgi:hypothetical protein
MAHLHAPGLVLRLDPQTLADEGASYTGLDDDEFSAQQYFVCIAADAKEALWVPLFAGPTESRKGIAASGKSGHPRWIKYTSFYDCAQLCRVAHKAIQRAAKIAYDESSSKLPNRLALDQLPDRAEFPVDARFRPMRGNISIR